MKIIRNTKKICNKSSLSLSLKFKLLQALKNFTDLLISLCLLLKFLENRTEKRTDL